MSFLLTKGLQKAWKPPTSLQIKKWKGLFHVSLIQDTEEEVCHQQEILPKNARVDTHLRNSATCKDSSTLPLNSTTSQPSRHLQAESAVAADEKFPVILNFTPQDQSTEDPQHKPCLKLPSSQEEWEDANCFFSQVLVPQVLQEISPDAKNNKLMEGIYCFFAERYGTTQPKKNKRQRRQEKLAQALISAKQMKKEARKELRQAKANGNLSADPIMSVARKFLQLVRSHKRALQHAAGKKRAMSARHQCHQNFWRFAKKLLADHPTTDSEPQF